VIHVLVINVLVVQAQMQMPLHASLCTQAYTARAR